MGRTWIAHASASPDKANPAQPRRGERPFTSSQTVVVTSSVNVVSDINIWPEQTLATSSDSRAAAHVPTREPNSLRPSSQVSATVAVAMAACGTMTGSAESPNSRYRADSTNG